MPAAMAPLAAALLWVLLLRPHSAGTWREHSPRLRVAYRGERLEVGAQGGGHRAVASPHVATSPGGPHRLLSHLLHAVPIRGVSTPGDVVPWGGGSMGPQPWAEAAEEAPSIGRAGEQWNNGTGCDSRTARGSRFKDTEAPEV